MNKTKVFTAAGAVVLAVGAFFAGKANKPYTSLSNIYYVTSGGNCKEAVAGSSFFTTSGASGVGIQFKTSGGNKSVFSDALCTSQISNKIYLKH